MANRLRRITSPGLPSTPRLMLDKSRRHARVSLCHPTWQSVERAATLTELLIRIAAGFVTWRIWSATEAYEPASRFFLSVIGYFASLALIALAFRLSLTGFLSRRVFATRTTFWFSPKGIAFRSRLYARPVVLWRSWKGEPVDVRFIVHDDAHAQELVWSIDRPRKLPNDHLKQARLLKVVLTTSDKPAELDCRYRSDGLRTIPITEVHADIATRCTMVYEAALAMTAIDTEHQTPRPAVGVDIESR